VNTISAKKNPCIIRKQNLGQGKKIVRNFVFKKISFLKFFIGFSLVSSLIIVILYNLFESGHFYIIKDVMAVIMLMLACLFNLKKSNMNIFGYFSFIGVIVSIGLFSSNASLFLIISSLRQFVVPFLFIIIGYLFVRNEDDYYSLLKFTIIFMSFIVLFGCFERFFKVWLFFDVSVFYKVKNIPVFSYGYPVFWIEPVSVLGYSTFENGIPRMVSSVLDPVNLGHLLVFTFAIIYFEGRRFFRKLHWFLLLVLMALGIFLTLSKGAWLQFGLALFIFNNRINFFWKAISSLLLLTLVLIYVLGHAGFLAHYFGFINVFAHINLLGHGLGSFGNYSFMYSDNPVEGVGDSYWAAVVGQFGVIGFVIWLGTFLFVAKNIGNHHLCWLLISQILISALSENSFNFMSVFLLLIFVGAFLKIRINGKMTNKRKGYI
jgi:hypothetical protein